MNFLIVAIGGALGALARYLISGGVTAQDSTFPVGTLAVNLSGAFLLGFFYSFALGKFNMPPEWRLMIAVGFLGAFTTFSTLSFDTFKLIENGAILLASLNLIGSMLGGLIAIYFGILVARLF